VVSAQLEPYATRSLEVVRRAQIRLVHRAYPDVVAAPRERWSDAPRDWYVPGNDEPGRTARVLTADTPLPPPPAVAPTRPEDAIAAYRLATAQLDATASLLDVLA